MQKKNQNQNRSLLLTTMHGKSNRQNELHKRIHKLAKNQRYKRKTKKTEAITPEKITKKKCNSNKNNGSSNQMFMQIRKQTSSPTTTVRREKGMESIVSLTCRQASGLRSMPKPSPRSLTTQAKKTGKKESKKENVTQKANIYTATTVIPSRHSQTPQKTGSQRRSKREERSTDDVPLLREAARMRAATTTGSTRMKTIRIKYIHYTVQLRDTVQYEDNVKGNTYTLQYKRRDAVQARV